MHRFTKRLLALLLALLMCLSLFPAAALAEGEDEPADEAVETTVAGSPDEPAEDEIPNDPDTELDALPPAEDEIEESSSGTCGDDLTWTLDENGLLTISGTGEIMDYGPVPPPFYQIGSQVLSLQIDTGVTAIGDYFLYGCSGLSSVTIPGNITRIGSYAFANCSGMTELVLCEGLLRIGEKAFSNCSSLYSLSIPASAAEFGDYPFNGCSSLTEIHYGGTVSAWQQLDLAYDRMKVTVYCADGNVTPIDPSLCGDNLTWSLSGDGVLTISGTGDMWNWEPCNSPDTTTPFVPAWSTQREQIKSVVIEPGVTSIGAHAFDCCTALTAVTIPDTVTQIRGNAFNQCSSLTGISIPESVTVIDSAVFQLCHALTDIVIPDDVTEIRTAAFNGCTSLSSLTLPASLSRIGEKAFLQCVGLTEIRFCGHAPSFGSDVFSCYSSDSVITATAYYPSGDATWTDAVRQNYGGNITWAAYSADASVVASGECGDDLTWTLDENGLLTVSGTGDMWQRLGEGPAWYEHTGEIKAVLVGEDVTSIRFSAFYYCENLTTVTILSAAQIGDDAFSYCPKLRTVRYGGTVDTWKQFSTGCDRYAVTVFCSDGTIQPASSSQCGDDLTWSVESGTLTIRGAGPMWNYSGNDMPWASEQFTAIAVEEGVTSIGDCAFSSFQYSGSVTSLLLPDSLLSIGNSAFSGCSNLSDVIIPEGVTSIGGWAFSPAENARISVPVSVTSIGDRAFGNGRPLDIDYGGTISQWKALVGPQTVSPYYATVHCLDGSSAKVVFPAEDPSWTEELQQSFGGDTLWWPSNVINMGELNTTCSWTLTDDGVLTVSGSGAMSNFASGQDQPWLANRDQITAVVVEEGVFSVGKYAFISCASVVSVSLPESLTTLRQSCFNGCSALEKIVIPARVTKLEYNAFGKCDALHEIHFVGNAPSFSASSFTKVVAEAYYPAEDESWTEEVRQNYGGTITWLPCMSVNEESVPDPIFRDYILQQFDSDGDGMLSEEERLAVTVIDLEGSGVASLEGIALFPNLEELNAGGDFETAGQLTEVDLSANTRLKSLNLGFNQDLGQLDVSMLPELESLMVGFCGLSELDLSGNPALRELWCDNNNLAALDLSANPNLEHLDCCGNEELYFLDIRPCPSLVADYKAGGRHISWMEEAMPEMYESILVYGGTGDEDYRLAVNTWTHIQYASFVLVSVSYYYSDTGFARGYSGGNLEGNDLTLTAEEKEGYSFLGWYLVTEKDETGLPVAYGELLCAEAAYTFVLSENISLVAVYEKESARTCTVSFDMQGHGTAPAAQTVNEGDCAAEPEAPTAEGWLFGGWYTDPDCTEPYAFTTPVTEDITLYAKWTPSGHLPGDINGDGKVNNKDVTRLQKYLKGDEVEVNEAALDMNGDGKVNNKDLTRLQKYLKGDEVEIF